MLYNYNKEFNNMREHYPKADIEQEYRIEKALQKLRKKRKQVAQQIISTYNHPYLKTKDNTIHPDDFIKSLKTPCQPMEINGMTVYSPGNDIVFKDVP